MKITTKPNQPNKLLGFFTGVDPATKNDYYTCVTHALMEKPRGMANIDPDSFKWIPFMVDIVRLRKRDPNDIMDLQIRQFNKFPPTKVTIDSTREDFLSAALLRKYGKSRIIPLKFSNSGASNTKFKLKQLGYAYIQAGYEWPNDVKLEKSLPRFAKLLRLLKKEMMMEQVKYTENQRVTFAHPIGKHNDLVHAWEMSLNSVMEYQHKNLGFVKRVTSDNVHKSVIDEIYKKKMENAIESEEGPVYDRAGASSLPFDDGF